MIYVVTLAFIVMDMVTGLIKAFKEKNYCSSIMREGLFHKTGSILCIVMGRMVDYAQISVGIPLTDGQPVTTIICTYIILMEIGSIIENVCIINPEIAPQWLKGFFKKLNADTQ